MRLTIGFLIAVLCLPTVARAQLPSPRSTLDISLPSPPQHQLSSLGPPGRLAVAGDGTLFVVSSSFQSSPDGILPARSARIELAAYSKEGAQKYRTLLPVQASIGRNGFNAESLGVVAFASGEAAVFLSSSNNRTAQPQDERSVTTIFRLDAAGKVLRAVSVAPPATVSGGFYRTKFYLPTADNGLLVGGGYGVDPFNWWIGKFDADGQRTWQAGPGPALPEDVYGLALKPDGTVSAIVQEIGQQSALSQWYVARFGADGVALGRAPFSTLGTSFAMLPAFWVSALSEFDTASSPELVRLDEQGNVLGRTPWRYGQTRGIIADGDGIAAIVCDTIDGPPCYVVRSGVDGKVRWRSAPGSISDIVRTPDGQLAAIRWSDDWLTARLVRYADP